MKRILFLLYFISFSAFSQFDCSDKNCMIVVDSGSTGSRAYLYQYQFSSNNTPVFIQEVRSNRLSPGLNMIGEDEGKISDYLSTLFNGFEQNQVSLPVYYYATAGMRLLSENKQKAIYSSIRKWFSQNKSAFTLQDLRTISGKEEGIFGWLAVNYLSGTFSSEHNPSPKVGVMDFGGASIQIAMAIDNTIKVSESDLTAITVSGKPYRIFSKSFLGLGINELTHHYLNDETCFSDNYPLPEGGSGQGDVWKCESHIERLTNNVHNLDKLSVAQMIAPIEQWFALGALEGLSASVPYHALPSPFTLHDIMQMADPAACHIEWDVLKGSDINNPYLYNTCLAAAYYYAIIVKGYGLNETTPIDTTISSSNKLMDWTYGVVIKQHN